MRNSSEGFWISMGLIVVMFIVAGITFKHVEGESETLGTFQEKCNKDNGVVISSMKGLTCIQKEVVLFTEK